MALLLFIFMMEQSNQKVVVELDSEVSTFLDRVESEFGLRNRGWVINQLLREMAGLNSQLDAANSDGTNH